MYVNVDDPVVRTGSSVFTDLWPYVLSQLRKRFDTCLQAGLLAAYCTFFTLTGIPSLGFAVPTNIG